MNGFTNSILSLLLSWLRLLIGQIWAALNSENGSRMLSFLQSNWKFFVICLAAGGFLADRLVYFLRWRPDIVWRTRRRARRARPADFSQAYVPTVDASRPDQPAHWEEPVPEDEPTQVFRGGNPSYTASGYLPREERRAVEDEHWQQTPPTAVQPQAAPWAAENAAGFDPVFDDDLGGWEQGDALVRPDEIQQAAQGMEQTFGASQPEPLNYIRDMQAGFARPLPPEQLYAAPRSTPASARSAEDTLVFPPVSQGYYSPNEPAAPQSAEPSAPIHPGLDVASFQRNFGWNPSDTAPQEPAPDFYSFADAERSRTENMPESKPRNPFAALARKARDFVGVDADDDTRSIRDWQPTVPVHEAFHEPVYPKNPNNHQQEGPSA